MVLLNDACAEFSMMSTKGTDRSQTNGDGLSLPVVNDRASLPVMERSRMGRRRAIVLLIVQMLIIVHVVIWILSREFGWFGGVTVTPIEPSESMEFVKRGTINAGLIFFVLALLSTLILGRWFCGWGCHVVLLQDGCLWMLRKIGIRPRPFRSRLLMWAPLVLALYMFVWPAVHRMLPFLPGQDAPWELGLHLTTSDFWKTFPGVWIGIVFLFICGFMTVYFLGAKGFCTYGCPYGGFFAPLDRFSPGRIRVTDACHQCGDCTAVCTSNVRVHEEVGTWGMVTDAGCMKTMDCVDTCPNDALYFGFGKTAVKPEARREPKPRRWDVSITGEIVLGVVFLAVFLSFRGAYASVPLLMAMGIACVLTYVFFQGWRLITDDNVHLHKLRMKIQGRFRFSGVAYLFTAVLLVGFTLQTGAVNWIGHMGIHSAREAMATMGPSGLSDSGRVYAESALARFDLARSIGLTTDPNHDVDAVQMHLLLGHSAGVEERMPRLLKRFPFNLQVRNLELDYRLATNPIGVENYVESLAAEDTELRPLRIRIMEWQVGRGQIADAEAYARSALASDAEDDEVRLRLAMLLIRTQRVDEGEENVRRYLETVQTNGKAWALLSEALAYQGRISEADRAIERARQLDRSAMVARQAMMHYVQTGRPQLAQAIQNDLQSGRTD
ncbi:MAG: hypothetical protein CMJ41_07160 [Phycisphaerae bacterium]|nr:hypothetical protein [Phycisphaerae bacterium]